MKKAILLNLVLVLAIAAHAQVTWQRCELLKDDADDVIFSSIDTGISCHTHNYAPRERKEPGTASTALWRTTDGGKTWQQVQEASSEHKSIASCKVATVKNSGAFYYVHRYNNELLVDKLDKEGNTRRITAGNTDYTDFSVPDTAHWFLLSESENTGYISTYSDGAFTSHAYSFTICKPALLDFPDASTGYIAAKATGSKKINLLLRSVNGGKDWQQVFNDTAVNINSLFFLSATTGYAACNGGLLLKTTDSGRHWEYITTELAVKLNAVCFLNEKQGYAAGSNGTVIYTNDGGSTWKKQATELTTLITKIFPAGDSSIFAFSGEQLYTNSKHHLYVHNNGEFVQSVKLAYHYQKNTSAELGYFLGFESHLSAWGGGWIYGPSASAEFMLKTNENRKTAIAPKIGFECYDGNIIGRFCGFRCCAAYYTDGSKYGSFKLEPEAGLSIMAGILSVFYGYNVPLTNASFVKNNGSKLTLILNIPYRFTDYYNPNKKDFL